MLNVPLVLSVSGAQRRILGKSSYCLREHIHRRHQNAARKMSIEGVFAEVWIKGESML